MTPADSLSILTTLFAAAVILMVLAMALVTALIYEERRNSPPPAGDVIAEPAVDGRGLIVIGAIVLAGLLAAGQVIHWAVS